MSDPAAEAPQTPAQALRALAAALEIDSDVPSADRIREILASFKAAGLDRPTQEMIIEAREDAKQGRRPDPLALRMIAKAISSRDTKSGKPARPKTAPIKAAPGLKDWTPPALVEMIPLAANLPQPRATTEPGDIETSAAAPLEPADVVAAVVDLTGGPVFEYPDEDEEEIDEEALMDHTDLAPGNAPGNGAPPIAQFDVFKAISDKHPVINGYCTNCDCVVGNGLCENCVSQRFEPEEPTDRTPAEWVALAADVIEHLDMPTHADLCGELYALAQRLEEQPLPDLSAAPLLDRVEAEITRRIEKAITSKDDLPEWVIAWARDERAKVTFEQDYAAPAGVGVEKQA